MVLNGGWGGEHGHGVALLEADLISGERGEIGEQGAEAMDGQSVVGSFGLRLAARGMRYLGLGDR